MLDRQGIPGKYSSTTNFLSIGKIPFLVKELRGQILCNPHKTESRHPSLKNMLKKYTVNSILLKLSTSVRVGLSYE